MGGGEASTLIYGAYFIHIGDSLINRLVTFILFASSYLMQERFWKPLPSFLLYIVAASHTVSKYFDCPLTRHERSAKCVSKRRPLISTPSNQSSNQPCKHSTSDVSPVISQYLPSHQFSTHQQQFYKQPTISKSVFQRVSSESNFRFLLAFSVSLRLSRAFWCASWTCFRAIDEKYQVGWSWVMRHPSSYLESSDWKFRVYLPVGLRIGRRYSLSQSLLLWGKLRISNVHLWVGSLVDLTETHQCNPSTSHRSCVESCWLNI